MGNKDTDFCVLKLGYNQYVVPTDVALNIFRSFKGMEIYRYDTEWDSDTKESYPIIKDMGDGEYPTIAHLSPSMMILGRERYRMKLEKEAAKDKQ